MRSGGQASVVTNHLEQAQLQRLMERSTGSPRLVVALLDGPVATNHPHLADAQIRAVGVGTAPSCGRNDSLACAHGTFIAGILAASRGSGAPAICPGCTLLVRPIFEETTRDRGAPSVSPEDLAEAIVECVHAGARIVNLSAATGEPSTRSEHALHEALAHAGRSGVLVVAAAGNQATIGSSVITRHPSVIPVVAIDRQGRPMTDSNLAATIGRRGLGAPGEAIMSLHPAHTLGTGGGTSSAAGFVTGAIALLWSLFPEATATELRRAVIAGGHRRAVTPPLLNAERGFMVLEQTFGRRR